MLLYELALLAVIAAGWFAGHWLFRRLRNPSAPEQEGDTQSEGLGDTIGFVGGAFGILLGLLLVFTVGHYVDARQVSKDEAATAAALFAGVHPFPAESRDPLRHDLVCYMRSVATDDWGAARTGQLAGAADTSAYAIDVQEQIDELPADTPAQENNSYLVSEEFLDLAKLRQMRLLHSVPEVPPAIWVVLYASTFLFVGLVVFRLGSRRRVARLAVGATTVLLVASVGALIELDAPYKGVGTSLRPVAMDAALTRLQESYPAPATIWQPCERLGDETVG